MNGNNEPKPRSAYQLLHKLTDDDMAELHDIKSAARKQHERNRKLAAKRGKQIPLLPYECSWAFEEEFAREKTKERDGN